MEEETVIQGKASSHALEKVKSEDETQDACVICLDAVSERAVAHPCRHHNFDFLCIVSWLQERTTCPLCKTKVQSVEYGFHSDDGTKKYVVAPVHADKTPSAPRMIHPSRHNSIRSNNLPPRNYRRQPQVPPPSPDSTLSRRRQVYRDQLYSLHIGSNRLSRFHDLTPEMFARSEELISRARQWIRRELQVFEFLNPGSGAGSVSRKANNAEFLLEYIVAILKTVDIKGSGGQAEDMLQEFLGRDNARLFLHELRAWLRSPYISLESWDRNVQYNDRVPSAKHQDTATRNAPVSNHDRQQVQTGLKRDHAAFRKDFHGPSDFFPAARKVQRRSG